MEASDDNADPMVEHPVAVAIWHPAEGQTLESVLGTVANKMRMTPCEVGSWVEAVRNKLEDIGIESVRDFVTDILVINNTLRIGGHRQLHRTTLKMIWIEVTEILFGTE